MPLSWALPSHHLMRETLRDGGTQGQTIGSELLRSSTAIKWVAEPEEYFDMLSPLSQSIDIWKTTYLQILEGDDPVFEWVKGTGLRPILNGLDEESKAIFIPEYKRRLRDAYPLRADGTTLFPFERLFLIAVS